ncbi:MAG: PQQ-binding-like beta-propeller repeat protein [Euryarchaeota archaeon]|nr:PQQ-binding-like beta-propeller repeat protein [Euryarchaeota archaeon]
MNGRIVIMMAMLLSLPVLFTGMSTGATGSGVQATVMFQFGNGETMSYTVTLPADNTTAIKATELACQNLSLSLNYTWGSYGAFVTQIGWEKNDYYGTGYYWHLMIWESMDYSWKVSSVGASSLKLKNGSVIAWLYTVDTPSWKPHNTVHMAPGYMDAWVAPRGNFNNTGVSYGNVTGDNIAWKFKGESAWGFSSTPVFSDGVIYIADSHALYALNMGGSELWNNTLGAAGYWGLASPAVYGNYVIIYSTNHTIRAFYRNNGTLAWATQIYGDAVTAPALGYYNKNPVLFYPTFVLNGTGSLYAIYADNGSIAWNVTLMGSSYFASPAVLGNSVVVSVGGIENTSLEWNAPYGVQCIAFNGSYMWNYSTASSVRSPPVIANNHIYVVTVGGNLLALNYNGTLAWKVEVGASTAPPAVHGTTIFVGNNSGGIMAISDSGTSGTVIWSHTLNGAVKAGLVYASGKIVAVTDTSNSEVYCYYANGTMAWNYSLGASSYAISSPVVVGSYLLVATNSGYLYAFTNNATVPAHGTMSVSKAVVGQPITVTVSAQETYMAVLYYRNTTGDEWHAVWMSYVNGEYVGYIPAQNNTGTVDLYVTLTDSSGTSSTTPTTQAVVTQAVPELNMGVFTALIIVALALFMWRKNH